MRLSKSIIGKKEVESVTRILLEDGYLGMGAEVGRFEADIATFLNVPTSSVVCVNSGTAALHLALEALSNPGDEILVPSLTYLSSFQAISAAGLVPIACEVKPSTLTIDLKDAQRKITSKTKAIMAVHYAGNPADIDELYELAETHNLRIIEDAAHAFGSKKNGYKIGSIGDIVCFSFDGIKNITSGEGGAIITNDDIILSIVKDTRLLAIEKDSEKRYSGKRSWEFDVKRQGYRYHMSNIFAAIGRVQLSRFEMEFAPKRKSLLQLYTQLLKNKSSIVLQNIQDNVDIVPHIMPVRVLNEKRDGLRDELEKNGVPTGIHYKPNHLLSFFNKGYNSLPVTEKLFLELLTLPLHPEISFEDVNYICEIILNYLEEK